MATKKQAPNTPANRSTSINTVLDPVQFDLLTAAANRLGQSRSEFVRQTIANRLTGAPLPTIAEARK